MPKRVPSYRKHTSGQARVTIRGRDYLLGTYNSPESRQEYARLIAEYLATSLSPPRKPKDAEPTIGDLLIDYVAHLDAYFGTATEGNNCKRAVRPLATLYAELPVSKFGPLEFKAVRHNWVIEGDRARGYINSQMARVLRFFKWAVAEGRFDVNNLEACRCVPPLVKGKCGLRESEPVLPVNQDVVDATLPHLTNVVADMVRLQILTGCRPGEIVKFSPKLIDRSKEVWIFIPEMHKNDWRGQSRSIYIGPDAQKVLAPYLLRSQDASCFSPIESERQRKEERRAQSKTPRKAKLSEKYRNVYSYFSTATYANSIRYACKKASLPNWSPLQLRHLAATRIREQFGIEAAQIILGHQRLSTTEIYAEKNAQLGIEIARKIG